MAAIHTPQEHGERLARIEVAVDHIRIEQADLAKDYAQGKGAAQESTADIKESIIHLRINGETLLRTVQAAHARIDTVDAELRGIDSKVDALEKKITDFETRIKVLISVGAAAVSVVWAVFGTSIQKTVGGFFGQ
jgi:hypothetical protein